MDIQVTYVSVNQRGQAQRDQRRVAGPVLIVGRGTQCQIHLPDPRVALNHARITVTEAGGVIEAATERIEVNGHTAASSKLAVGDWVEIGPYFLRIEAPPAGVPLALTVTQTSPLADKRRSTLFSGIAPASRLSKRRLSYLAFGGVLLLCLLVPVAPELLNINTAASGAESKPEMMGNVIQMVSVGFTQAWNPGPVSRSHQPFSADCHACHEFPFIQVRDQSCIACHKAIKEHVPRAKLTGVRGVAFLETRCAQCHRDHKGMQMAPRAQEQCADCHRDVKNAAPGAHSEKVTDFRSDHPQFRLSLIDADRPEVIRRVRQANPPAADMVERSNLKFNHALHIDPAGVRDPEGKRDAAGMRDAQGRRTVLKCANCHEPDDGGRLMAPVSMEQHCQQCHSLSFEPKVTKRQVPHGSEEDMATMLREFYARLVLGDVAPEVKPSSDLRRMRPGAVLTAEDRRYALQIADQKAQRVLREMFETRKVCSTCHYVTRKPGNVGWEVAPVRMARVWMPQALFTHAKHSTQSCTTCHDVSKSKEAKQIAMPDLAKCRECHVGARAVAGRVTSDCATCHKFHAGRDYWHGAMQAQMLPRGTR